MSRAVALQELERRVERVEGRPAAGVETVPTGLVPLDALLPQGGLPRGRATEWSGPRSCGKLALLRRALSGFHALGEPVALIDALRLAHAPDWVELSECGPAFWFIRPPPGEAAWCADMVLRSGAFGAIVLDVADGPLSGAGVRRGVGVRLQRLAEEAGSILIMLAELPVAGLRLHFRPGRVRPDAGFPFGPFLPSSRPVRVRVGRGRWVELPVACSPPALRSSETMDLGRDRKGPL